MVFQNRSQSYNELIFDTNELCRKSEDTEGMLTHYAQFFYFQ
jgi:hypothetical protein